MPIVIFVIIVIPLTIISQDDSRLAQASAKASLQYLKRIMDQYHNQFAVYKDISSAGNHFHAFAKIPDSLANVDINGSFISIPTKEHYTGATVIRCTFMESPNSTYGGYYFLNGIMPQGNNIPIPNFGHEAEAGIDLSGALKLTFWAKGELGGEKIDFFMGGIGRDPASGIPTSPFPDSSPRIPTFGTTYKVLDTIWRMYSIDLTNADLSYVLGGFGWVANSFENPNGVTFYLDDIEYQLSDKALQERLNKPRFLQSFSTLPVQSDPNDSIHSDDFDLVLRNLGYSYDNALAILAFLADPSEDHLSRARLIGDAFVYASENDRFFTDGRIRDAYAVGDISLPPGWVPTGKKNTVPVPGFYDEISKIFHEVESSNLSIGNNAWVMTALLALYKKTLNLIYLKTAQNIGKFISQFQINTGLYRGFTGGLESIENNPKHRQWASTEHHLDIIASFSELQSLAPDPLWPQSINHAKIFIDSMWNSMSNCYFTGTLHPNQINRSNGQLPLDAQSWSILASPPGFSLFHFAIECAENNHFTNKDGFSGFDFNEDKDGIWFEGTAQMATAYTFSNLPDKALNFRAQLRNAQSTSPFGDGEGISAASHDHTTSGFGFTLFRRLHVGATSWNVFAQLQYNPYYQIFKSLQTDIDNEISNTFLNKLNIFPNPTKGKTNIAFSISQKQPIVLRIIDLNGKITNVILNKVMQPGQYSIAFDNKMLQGQNRLSGIYIAQLCGKYTTVSKKIIIL